MTAHNRKLKNLTLGIGGNEFQIQLREWIMENNTDDAETFYVYVEGQEFAETPEPSYSLNCTFYADWRSAGISDYLWLNKGTNVPFQVDHHPDIPGEHVRWTGTLHVKAPNVGGEVRTTEITEATFQVVGEPVYSRP